MSYAISKKSKVDYEENKKREAMDAIDKAEKELANAKSDFGLLNSDRNMNADTLSDLYRKKRNFENDIRRAEASLNKYEEELRDTDVDDEDKRLELNEKIDDEQSNIGAFQQQIQSIQHSIDDLVKQNNKRDFNALYTDKEEQSGFRRRKFAEGQKHVR